MVKKLPANAGDTEDAALIPGLGRYLGEGNNNPLQYSGLENPMTEEPGRLQSMGSQSDLARICMWLSPLTVPLKLSQHC